MEQREKYNRLWGSGDVQRPQNWSVWKVIKEFKGKKNLEIGAGNYPRIPIEGGFFVDISERAIRNIEKAGGKAFVGDATNLPFEKEFFDLAVGIEVLEHIDNDKKAFSEIVRVLKPSGFFLFSVPLRKELYEEFDYIFGHKRRYEIAELKALLSEDGFKILKFRQPSFYLAALDAFIRFAFIKKLIFRNKKHETFFSLPKPLVNLYAKIFAFLDKKGAPRWRTDIDSLPKYKNRSIIIFCQKA